MVTVTATDGADGQAAVLADGVLDEAGVVVGLPVVAAHRGNLKFKKEELFGFLKLILVSVRSEFD